MSAESEQARRALSSTQKRQHTTQSSGHLLKPADSSKQPKRLWKHRKDDCFKFQQRTARSEGRLDRGRRQLDPASPTGCCNCCCTLLRRRVCWGCSTADLQIVAGIIGSTWGHGEHFFCSFLLATDAVPQCAHTTCLTHCRCCVVIASCYCCCCWWQITLHKQPCSDTFPSLHSATHFVLLCR